MSDQPKIYIAAMGMITAIGGSALTTAAAVRARRKGMRMSPHYNKNFNPMTVALVPNAALPPLNPQPKKGPGLTARQRRMVQLATPALNEALSVYALKDPIPLFLAGPETLPGCPSPTHLNLIDSLIAQTGAKINREQSRVIATGRAGGVQALDLAFRYFETTGKDAVLIGGVDTYLDYFLLSVLDTDNRILAEGIKDGFVPGEAAGFLLLVSEKGRQYLKQPPLGTLYRPGLASEPGHRYSDVPYRGDGLADAVRLAIQQGNGQKIHAIYSSMNGESFGAKEYGVACARNSASLAETVEHEHPADGFGDIGAACGPVLMGLAALDLQKGWRQGPALVYCSSDGEQRAAVCVSA
jgi:3-oxoacyl-[acyl-carrier-protein] synthase-1